MVSIIAIYITSLLFLAGTYAFAFTIDLQLYEASKKGETGKRILSLGVFSWLFLKCKKDGQIKSIYIIVFVHEVIGLFLFLASTCLFIVSLVLMSEYIVLFGLIGVFIFFLYWIALLEIYKKRAKRKNEVGNHELSISKGEDNEI